MLWKCCTQYASKFGKLSSDHRTGKVSFHSNAKECSNCSVIVLISHTSKVMLKLLEARLQQHMKQELPDVQAGFRKGKGTRGQIANIHWIREKARKVQKTSASLTILKPLTVWITTNCRKSLQRWEYQTTFCLRRDLYAGQEATELDMELQNWKRSM